MFELVKINFLISFNNLIIFMQKSIILPISINFRNVN